MKVIRVALGWLIILAMRRLLLRQRLLSRLLGSRPAR